MGMGFPTLDVAEKLLATPAPVLTPDPKRMGLANMLFKNKLRL